VYSLLRIATFVRQRHLGDKSDKDISQIANFGHATWDLISAIYEAGWNKLSINNNNRSLYQHVASKFNNSS